MVRGAPASTLPRGIRQDTRKHTRHVLRPTVQMVERLLANASSEAQWQAYAKQYRALLAERLASDRKRFDALADLARKYDVLLGCNCPTARNPDVHHCHTVLALEFMKAHYPDLDVRMPR